jgi:SAM-dependent methyltransferase
MSRNYITDNKIAYDAIATPFSQSRTFRFGELPLLVEFLKPGQTIVDVGCGTGRLYQFLVQNQALGEDVIDDQNVLDVRYVGIDQSIAQLEAARKDFPEAEWIEGKMAAIPLEDKSADILFCIATFHHLPDTETRLQALHEMHRVLKPGGRLVMSNWNFESDWVASKLAGPDTPGIESKWKREGDHFFVPWMNPKRDVLGMRHYWAISPEEHKSLHSEAGFQLEELFYTRQDKKVEDVAVGMNIVTIAHK